MTDRLSLLHLRPLSGEGAGGGCGGAECSALRAGLVGGQFGRLLFEEQLEGALGQPVGGGVGDLLERAEVHVQAGAVVPERPLGDDLGPLPGQVVQLS